MADIVKIILTWEELDTIAKILWDAGEESIAEMLWDAGAELIGT